MTSWKTTLCGTIAAAAGGVAISENLSPTIRGIAKTVAVVAGTLMAYFARDNSVTSEQAGAKPDNVINK